MRPPIIPREQVAARLAVEPGVLVQYEARGLIRVVREGAVEGYEPAEVRRVWSVLSLHREAGVNLAGIEAILQLRAQFDTLARQMLRLSQALEQTLDDEDAADAAVIEAESVAGTDPPTS